jgi:hypothetical protein
MKERKEENTMKNRKVLAFRIIGILMLIMGIIGVSRGSTAAIACLCASGTMINASNLMLRKNK